MLGRRIGSWILEQELGHGAMGAVYAARHVSLDTRAAVKVLSAGLESEEAFRQRFQREANLQAQLRHSNVARVLDYLEDGGRWFLVIEYLERGSLFELLARGEKVSRAQAIAWTRQALAGLAHAHRKGVVHRDIKPANLMFSDAGEIVVVDFGIARAEENVALTATGIAIGTPAYMSPEQIKTPNRVDGRADIYSLGIVLYELLAGRKPFTAPSSFALLQAHVFEPPPPLRSLDPGIPPELEAVAMRALAKNPDDRFADCDAMIRALDLVAAAQPAAPTMNVSPPVVANAGGTVVQSMLYAKTAAPVVAGPSSGEMRNRRRRSFQWRLAGATATVLALAAVLATNAGLNTSDTPKPIIPDPPITVTTVTTDTVTPVVPDPPSKKKRRIDLQPVADQASVVNPPPVVKPEQRPVSQPVAPPRPVLPEKPRIAVIGIGNDPMFAAAIEQEMERRLSTDHLVADEHADPDVDDLLARRDPNVRALGAQLLKSGFHILVVVRVEQGDERMLGFNPRTLRFEGQSGSLKAARLRLTAYLLPTNSILGPGWTQPVEYTELSLETKAKMAFIGQTVDLRQIIDDEWAKLK